MKVSIERGHFEALLAEFPRLQPWAAQLRFGNRVEMAFADLHDAELAQLVARYQAGGVDYVMYSDGSIEADNGGARQRFATLAELKAFIGES